jgi:hypothetical protein
MSQYRLKPTLLDCEGKTISDSAWENFHKIMARIELKYRHQLGMKESA